MSFHDKFGVTKIIEGRRHNLSVSFDKGVPRLEDNEVGLVFLYTPDMENTNTHYHITLTKKEMIKIKEWIESFISEQSIVERYNKDLKRKN